MINLRYGSLNNFDEVNKTYYAIAKELKMPQSTVRFICVRFESVGRSLERLVNKPRQEFRKIPPDIQQNLLDPRLLQLWAPYSIVERRHLLENTWGLKISHQLLW